MVSTNTSRRAAGVILSATLAIASIAAPATMAFAADAQATITSGPVAASETPKDDAAKAEQTVVKTDSDTETARTAKEWGLKAGDYTGVSWTADKTAKDAKATVLVYDKDGKSVAATGAADKDGALAFVDKDGKSVDKLTLADDTKIGVTGHGSLTFTAKPAQATPDTPGDGWSQDELDALKTVAVTDKDGKPVDWFKADTHEYYKLAADQFAQASKVGVTGGKPGVLEADTTGSGFYDKDGKPVDRNQDGSAPATAVTYKYVIKSKTGDGTVTYVFSTLDKPADTKPDDTKPAAKPLVIDLSQIKDSGYGVFVSEDGDIVPKTEDPKVNVYTHWSGIKPGKVTVTYTADQSKDQSGDISFTAYTGGSVDKDGTVDLGQAGKTHNLRADWFTTTDEPTSETLDLKAGDSLTFPSSRDYTFGTVTITPEGSPATPDGDNNGQDNQQPGGQDQKPDAKDSYDVTIDGDKLFKAGTAKELGIPAGDYTPIWTPGAKPGDATLSIGGKPADGTSADPELYRGEAKAEGGAFSLTDKDGNKTDHVTLADDTYIYIAGQGTASFVKWTGKDTTDGTDKPVADKTDGDGSTGAPNKLAQTGIASGIAMVGSALGLTGLGFAGRLLSRRRNQQDK